MTSKQIFAETIQELAEEIPIDRITVKQIVEESGLSLQTFYNHFHDKADLVVWVHLSETEKFFQKMIDSPRYQKNSRLSGFSPLCSLMYLVHLI